MNVVELYRVADYFKLNDLVSWCIQQMCRKIQMANVFDRLRLACQHGGEGGLLTDEHGYTLANVKIAAIKFIVDHWLVVKDEPGYLQLIKDYAELDIDITDAINSIK